MGEPLPSRGSSIAQTTAAVKESRDLVAGADMLYAEWARSYAAEATASLQRYAADVEQLLPDRAEAASLSFGYSSAQALTEINGALVRILDGTDEIETIPDGTDIATNLIPATSEAKIRAACVAAYDLELKILGYEADAPSGWERLGASAREVGAGVGDALTSPLEGFLAKAVENLWFWLAVLGVILFFVYFKVPAKAVAAVA